MAARDLTWRDRALVRWLVLRGRAAPERLRDAAHQDAHRLLDQDNASRGFLRLLGFTLGFANVALGIGWLVRGETAQALLYGTLGVGWVAMAWWLSTGRRLDRVHRARRLNAPRDSTDTT